MSNNINHTEVTSSYYGNLVTSAMRGILPHIKGNLIQEGNKIFLDRKVPTFLGKSILEIPELPEEFILE